MNAHDLPNDIAAIPFPTGIQLQAALESDERRIVAGRIESGQVLGSWLFASFEWQSTARALTQTSALFFTDPSLGFELFKRMAQEMVNRAQSARRRLLEAAPGSHRRWGAGHAINGGG